jgi:hypothetical protein
MSNLYKKRFPKRSFQDTVFDVLRLNDEQWNQLKGIANHYLGDETFHPSIPRYPPTKLLPSSLRQIRDIDHPTTLASLLHVEDKAHHDPTKEFNRGGGLLETTSSLFSTLWNLVGFGPEFKSMFDYFGWTTPSKKETPLDRQYAQIVQESYKSIDKRADNVDDWLRLPRFDNDRFSAWVQRDEKIVHVALKGTSTISDVFSDLSIIGSNHSGHEKEVRDYLRDVVRAYGHNYTYDVSAHSLGGAELVNVFNEDDSQLNKYDRINVFNPGSTPTHNLSAAKDAIKDERFHFFLNSGDLLSNTYGSLIPSGFENVVWGSASHNPMYNHSLGQWIETV